MTIIVDHSIIVCSEGVTSSGEKEELENSAKEIFDKGEEQTEAEEEFYEDSED